MIIQTLVYLRLPPINAKLMAYDHYVIDKASIVRFMEGSLR